MTSRLVKLVLLALWTALCAYIAIKMLLQHGWLYAICMSALTAYLVFRVVLEIRTLRAGARGDERAPRKANRSL